jgi:2-polyprenyl-3-methyl-5-hydroxy-6-metoxy-1,4-benzoquinol methylase
MTTMSILGVSILVFIANASAQQKIVRKELYKANIGTQPISMVDVREVVFQPKQNDWTASASLSGN